MSASTLRRGSSVSQLLRETKDILQDVTFGARYVRISGIRHVGWLKHAFFSVASGILDTAEVDPTEINGRVTVAHTFRF
jgi:hypothetical protein